MYLLPAPAKAERLGGGRSRRMTSICLGKAAQMDRGQRRRKMAVEVGKQMAPAARIAALGTSGLCFSHSVLQLPALALGAPSN